MKRIYIRTISSLLALLILFTSMDMSAFAYEADDALEAFVSTESDDENEMTEPEEGVPEELPSVDDEDFDSLSDTEDETSIDRAEEGDESSILGTDDDGSAVTSGSCGDNLTWALEGSENALTLHISGTGDMYDYQMTSTSGLIQVNTPWFDRRSEIVTCIIDDGVTSIGQSAFCALFEMTSVKIPSTVTRIGKWAFCACSSLTSIELPPLLTSIEFGAFQQCSGLIDIDFPDSLTSIGNDAFLYCFNLTSVELPPTVTSIGEGAFWGCYKLASIKMPPSLTRIEDCTFYECRKLTSIELPPDVTSIGEMAFQECYKLTSIELPSALTSIGKQAFTSCSSLTQIKWPSSVPVIMENTFHSCKSLTSIELPITVTSIGKRVFYGCDNLKDVYYQGSRDEFLKISMNNSYMPDGVTIHYNCEMPGNGGSTSQEEKHEYSGIFGFALSGSDEIEQTPIKYSVDLHDFFNSSYDHDATFGLTKMSIRVAMAAMDPDSYTKSGNRAGNIKDLMTQLDFQYDEEDIEYETPDGNTIGTAIGSRTVKRGDEEFTLLMVAVRGGGYLNEWAGNVNVGDGHEGKTTTNHNGFDIASETVLSRIRGHLDRHQGYGGNTVKVWICGYSRAAAVSNLTAAKLDKGAIPGIYSDDVFAYCFECPKNTTDWRYNNADYANITNIVNLVDFVPLVAPRTDKGWEFYRYGTTYFIDYTKRADFDFANAYYKMKDAYKKILGSYYSKSKLDSLLSCYESGDAKYVNQWNREFLYEIIHYIDSSYKYVTTYQNAIYKKVKATINSGSLSLVDIIKLVVSVIKSIGIPEDAIKAAGKVYSYVAVNHYPELTLAWVDTLSKNEYTTSPTLSHTSKTIYNCPVDITVYDSSDNIVTQIVHDEVAIEDEIVGAYVDEDGQKVVLLPDNSYRTEAKAYDDGDVTITVMDYSEEDIAPQKVESYLSIDVSKDDILTTTYTDGTTTVTDNSGSELNPDVSQTGENVISMSVEATAEGSGTVEGGGVYNAGEFSQVTAIPDEGNIFTGWYADEELVSAEQVYRFAVLQDTTLIAKFAEAVDKGEVLEEDIPDDGVIPEGLWIGRIEDATYTGKAIKPDIRVYDGKRMLKAGIDYTLSYANNTKAYTLSEDDSGFFNSKGKTLSPVVTVTGKGNYSGKETAYFKILPVDISKANSNTYCDSMSVNGTGRAQKPVPVMTVGGKAIKANTDYSIAYYAAESYQSAEDSGTALASVKDYGEYWIRLTGKGNYSGIRDIPLTVVENKAVKLMTKLSYSKIANQSYDDSNPIKPAITVKDGPYTLVARSESNDTDYDYSVVYENNKQVGTGYAVVTGNPDKGYSGTKRIAFKITGSSLFGVKFTGLPASVTYSGDAISFDDKLKTGDVSVVAKGSGKALAIYDPETGKGDYKTSYKNNVKAGTATLTLTGTNGYTGTVSKTFKILPCSLNSADIDVKRATEGDVPYAKGGAKESVVITYSGKKLKEGTDYTLTYKNNTKAGNTASVTVKGKGNFKDTYSKSITYTVATRAISGVTIDVADKAYQKKKNAYKTTIKLYDTDGKVLKEGSDYDIIYNYPDGATVPKDEIIPAGTKIRVTVNGKNNYSGSISRDYRITKASISGAKVSASSKTYTGKPLTLSESDITFKIGNKKIEAADPENGEKNWEIVPGSYRNNTNKGKASLQIRGLGNYGGVKTVEFKITAKGFRWWWR